MAIAAAKPHDPTDINTAHVAQDSFMHRMRYPTASRRDAGILGRYSIIRFILTRGLLIAGAIALVASFKVYGVPGGRPFLAVTASGLSTLAGNPVQSSARGRTAGADRAFSAGDCTPFVCASGPYPKWASAPPSEPSASEPPNYPRDLLVVRSDLTGEPYPIPDKPAVSPVAPKRAVIAVPRQ